MKKTILTLVMALMMVSLLSVGTAYASEEKTKEETTSEEKSGEKSDEKSDEKSEEKSDEKSDDEKSEEEKSGEVTEVTATAEDYNITTNDDNTVTFLRADGTVMASVNVTVKNNLEGADGDISRDEFATDENGVFDYSTWVEDDVYILRLTDPNNSYSLEYVIESGELTISAGKSKSGDGTSNSKTNLYMIIGGVAAILVIGVVTAVVMVKQKKKKAAFAQKANKKATKKN